MSDQRRPTESTDDRRAADRVDDQRTVRIRLEGKDLNATLVDCSNTGVFLVVPDGELGVELQLGGDEGTRIGRLVRCQRFPGGTTGLAFEFIDR